jgi:glycerol-3-phosphate acyltransferase PlsY
MEWWCVLGSGVAGYLIGGISFARLIAVRVIPDRDISKVEEKVPGTEEVFVMDTVSATTMRVHAGTRFGCLTALLDMLKVALPTLVLRALRPEAPDHLFFAAAAVAGHNWPLYYRFKGGRGESPMIGGMLVIDWPGVIITNAIGSLGGFLLGSLLVMRWSWMFLMIGWLWWRTGDPWSTAYASVVVLLYFLALRGELEQYVRLKLGPNPPNQETIGDFLAMGKRMGRFMDRYSLFGLYHRYRSPKGP